MSELAYNAYETFNKEKSEALLERGIVHICKRWDELDESDRIGWRETVDCVRDNLGRTCK